jgi:glutamine synthetase adenylyltransferase
MSTTARDSLPDDPHEQANLARSLGLPDAATLLAEVSRYTHENRKRFDQILAEAEGEAAVLDAQLAEQVTSETAET